MYHSYIDTFQPIAISGKLAEAESLHNVFLGVERIGSAEEKCYKKIICILLL